MRLRRRCKGLNAGGNLSIIELEDAEYKPEALMELTTRLMENQIFRIFHLQPPNQLLRQLQEKLVRNPPQMPLMRLHEHTDNVRPIHINLII